MPANKTVLVVEDSPDDVLLFERAFRQAGLSHSIISVAEGAEALRYVSGEARYSDRTQFPFPSVMFLDLRLPDINGFDVLKAVRQTHTRAELRIIVLTGSGESANVRRAYALGADSFIVKPPRSEDFRNLARGFPDHF